MGKAKKIRLRIFEIWSEGYRATGQKASARFHGLANGMTFADACSNFFGDDPLFKQHEATGALTYWGCQLFDSEDEARQSFG